MWRILLALGILPAICIVYSQFHLPESVRYAEQVLKDAHLAAKDRAYALGNDSVDPSTNASTANLVQQNQVSNNGSHIKEFLSYFSYWANFKVLLDTCSTWVLLDIVFYGLTVDQSNVLSAIYFTQDSTTTLLPRWDSFWK